MGEYDKLAPEIIRDEIEWKLQSAQDSEPAHDELMELELSRMNDEGCPHD